VVRNLNFNSIKWQNETVDNIKNCIASKTLGHAVLFCGEKKTCLDMAHASSDAIICDTGEGNACGRCPSCTKTNAGSHPDKIIIKTEKATLGINEVREFISNAYVRPFISNFKVCIFEDADKLTGAAQNALLKILEAPPDYCIIFIVCEKEENLLPTVLSRLKKYTMKIPTGAEVGQYLAGKYPEKRDLALFCGKFCEGSPNGAEELLLNGGYSDRRRRLCNSFIKLGGKEKSTVFDFANYLTENKVDFIQNAAFINSILRDVIFLHGKISPAYIVNSDIINELSALSKITSSEKITKITNGLSSVLSDIDKNAAFKLSILNYLLKVWEDLHD
jgi:DNA polymerase-3 subunit delta'